jgi:type II secretory pathway component PulF
LIEQSGLGARAVQVLSIALLIPVGACVYAVVLWLLRIEGRDELQALVARIPVLGAIVRPPL